MADPRKKLQPGDTAPDFELSDADGKPVRLSRLTAQGKRVVLYFYPMDNTPNCTAEACRFSEEAPHFAEKGAVVIGVSMNSTASHARFRDQRRLALTLLSDPEGKVIEAYGAFRTGILGIGRTALAIIRSTFLIDEKGIVRKALYGVKVKGHAEEMLGALGK